MKNYFNTLSTIEKMDQLSKCRFMNSDEFDGGVSALLNKKIVIIGCGAQGLNQGLNMRDSGLDISYSLRKVSIEEKRQSFLNATNNGFTVGNFEDLIPNLLCGVIPPFGEKKGGLASMKSAFRSGSSSL